MKYAVQFSEPRFFGVPEVTVDTDAISLKEAIELFTDCRKRFVKAFNRKEEANLVIWEDVGDGEFPNYHTTLVDLDTRDELRLIHGVFYKTSLVKINEPE